jgi:hypothetical protein
LSDGFEKPLNWSRSGYEMSPMNWHKELENNNINQSDKRVLSANGANSINNQNTTGQNVIGIHQQ